MSILLDKKGLWLISGALGGWLAAYPLAVLTLWLVAGTAGGSVFAEIVQDNLPQLFRRMLPVNVCSALIGLFVGLISRQAFQRRQALRESEERFRNLAASAPDAIIMMSRDGRISFWNAAAQKTFGHSREEAIGMDLHRTLVPQRLQDGFEKGYGNFLQTGRGHAIGKTLELAAMRKDGTEFPIELSLSAFHLRGEWHAIGIVRDISDRKQAEQEQMAREKLEGVLEMAGATCHNMNQPLQTLVWHVQMMLEELPNDSPLREHLQIIKSQVDRMWGISKKIMDITRYETVDYYKDIKIIDIDKASGKL